MIRQDLPTHTLRRRWCSVVMEEGKAKAQSKGGWSPLTWVGLDQALSSLGGVNPHSTSSSISSVPTSYTAPSGTGKGELILSLLSHPSINVYNDKHQRANWASSLGHADRQAKRPHITSWCRNWAGAHIRYFDFFCRLSVTDARIDLSSLSERAKQVYVSFSDARGKGNSTLLIVTMQKPGVDPAWDPRFFPGAGLQPQSSDVS